MACCNSEEERQIILQRFSPVIAQLANVNQAVQSKAEAQSLLAEHLTASKELQQKIAHIQESLSNKTLSPENVARLRADLDDARSELTQLEAHQVEVKVKMAEAGIVFQDRSTGEALNIEDKTQLMLAEIDNDNDKLKFCERIVDLNRRMQEADQDLSNLKHIYTDDVDSMGSAVQVRNIMEMFIRQ